MDSSVDVLIVGAGISGIGAAYYLQRDHPQRSYAILEARGASGGTWDLFRYPGIRSDSDLFTFGFEFRPWKSDVSIADGGSILAYLRETAAEYGIDRHIRYRTKAVAASWSSDDACWTVAVEHTETGERDTVTCRWLLSSSGYYRYDNGYAPDFPGRERFAGPVVHPQHWPADLDYAGKRVVVIGSGATAVTLLPAMAGTAAHVIMLQRTPSYILPVPTKDKLNARLRRLLGEDRAFRVTRRLSIFRQIAFWRLCQRYPGWARKLLRDIAVKQLPEDYPVNEHFNPPYNPWDQRMCVVPDADLFRVIREGKAAVVTGQVETFTEGGVQLTDGRLVEADIIVTATGLRVQALGGMTLTVDGAPVRAGDRYVYKGLMLSGTPNFAFTFGYTNISWTLKVGIAGGYLSRLLRYMDDHGYAAVTPEAGPGMTPAPFTSFSPGYIQRALVDLPKQGSRPPWRIARTYAEDARLLRGQVADPALRFTPARERVPS
jgi:cation diffusion facilitator CzcD-associated flavoprotein CzcO